ncbi:MAG: GntR family transcriptional regulator, partial [Bacillota bacterium]
MAVDELTKKEQIINFAQSDPFLKINDIADYVETTPRYVRTILSEADISLMKLREKYARNMEER